MSLLLTVRCIHIKFMRVVIDSNITQLLQEHYRCVRKVPGQAGKWHIFCIEFNKIYKVIKVKTLLKSKYKIIQEHSTDVNLQYKINENCQYVTLMISNHENESQRRILSKYSLAHETHFQWRCTHLLETWEQSQYFDWSNLIMWLKMIQ